MIVLLKIYFSRETNFLDRARSACAFARQHGCRVTYDWNGSPIEVDPDDRPSSLEIRYAVLKHAVEHIPIAKG
jgi:hypothetical protein